MNLIEIIILSLVMSSVLGLKNVPRIDQRSLIIIFDGTQSMGQDLEQLRNATEKIVNEFSIIPKNPIYNYVLAVFRDPDNDEIVSALSPAEFLENLGKIDIGGGGDCPEMSLTALYDGINYGLSKSVVYVITDAIAKDHIKYVETVHLFGKKQSTVNFILTGDCGQRDKDGYKVYGKLARHGNGQVFHTETDGIENVLLALRNTMKDNYTPNQNGRTSLPGKSVMPFFVDDTMTDIDIRLCGVGAKMTIKNPLNQIVTGDDLTLENLKIVSFKNPMAGRWTVEAESTSEYTIQIGSNSDLKILYGFSFEVPNRHGKTSVQPLKRSKNILTFFISDPTKVDYLSAAVLIFENNKKAARTIREIHIGEEMQLKLTKISDYIYATELFDVPKGTFKVQLYGVDSNGNDIERLVSKAIEAIEPSAPEVSIIASELGESVTYSCIVKSLIPVNIQWYHQDKLLKEINSSQSNECDITMLLNESNSENYTCKAVNDIGSDMRIIQGGNLVEPNIYESYEDVDETTIVSKVDEDVDEDEDEDEDEGREKDL